jgi:sterol 3beta-glucosyltransferase
MIHKAGVGPAPIPHKKLNAENLRDAIHYALSPEAKLAAT